MSNYLSDMDGYPLLPRITVPTYRFLCTGDASIKLRYCFHSTTRSSAIPTTTLPDITAEYMLTILYLKFPSGTVCSFVSAPGLGSRTFVRSLRHNGYPLISDLRLLCINLQRQVPFNLLVTTCGKARNHRQT